MVGYFYKNQVGGPTWTVKLGRRDSMSASQSLLAESNLPRATDDLDDLISLFGSKGLSSKEMVALSGIKIFSFDPYSAPLQTFHNFLLVIFFFL